MQIKIKYSKNILLILLLLVVFCTGQVLAQTTEDLSNAVYLNPSYVQELTPKTNCDLNGAWSTEYSYYWLSDPTNSQAKSPSYVKSITYTGVVQESSSISISTLESSSKNNERNKYYLSSSLPGEPLEITIDLENTNDFKTWLSINLYFDPFVIKNPEQQIKLKLSYANSALGNIVYIQNTKFNVGCYLNLLVKSPDPHSSGKVTIEINSQDDSIAAISGIFWSEPRKESDLKISYTGLNKVSAPVWFQNLRTDLNTVIWSPKASENLQDDFVTIGVGEIAYTTSTGYEFPKSLKRKGFYNFKVLKGMPGPKGVNGLEFYLTPDSSLCLNGCDLGLYSTESYKQNVFIYSAEKDKKNKLEVKTETPGDGGPAFQNFHIDPSTHVQLRIRMTTNDLQNVPVLRGLYISPSRTESTDTISDDLILNLDKGNTIQNPIASNNISQPTIQTIAAGIIQIPIQIPQVVIFTPEPPRNTTNDFVDVTTTKPNTSIQIVTNTQPLAASQINPMQPPTNSVVTVTPPTASTPAVSNTQTATITPPTVSPPVIPNTQATITTPPDINISSNNTTTNAPIIKHAPTILGDIANIKKGGNGDSNSDKKNSEDQNKVQEDVQKAQQQALEDAKKALEETQKAEHKAQEEAEKVKQKAIEDVQKVAEEIAKAQEKAAEETQKPIKDTVKKSEKIADEIITVNQI